ncbi:MAG: class I SAM-dependent RNA methyltransferase [Spirochaetales bacterium]
MSKGSLRLVITALNENGYGVGQKAGQTLTVARTAPGDQVLVGPPKTTERWSSADLLQVVSPGPDRIVSPCRAFTEGCGGCQWLHLTYSAQISWKQKNLAELLRTRAGYRGPIEPLVRMEKPEAYRNKLSLKNAGGRLVFVPEFDAGTLAPAECLVQTRALQTAWAALRGLKVPPALEQLHLRSNLLGAVGLHAFVKALDPATETALKSLFAALPGAVGLGATTRQGYRLVSGEAALAQTLPDVTASPTWLIPHNGFFQTNAAQAGVLLDLVRREARLAKTDRLLDLYCGAGFFGLALASSAREVVGLEENPQSVAAATNSAAHSGVTNARFLVGDLGAVLASLEGAGGEVSPREVAVVDPPREGLLPRALDALVARAPKRLVYVSCHAPSLARDYKVLAKAGYRGVNCTPIDMFPHTSHLETVMTMEKSR